MEALGLSDLVCTRVSWYCLVDPWPLSPGLAELFASDCTGGEDETRASQGYLCVLPQS